MGIKLDSNFNEVEPAEAGGYSQPPAGGYVFIVIDVSDKPSQSKKEMITLSLDIAQGEYAGAFKKFPRKFFQLVNGSSLPFFKGMLKAFRESNPEEKMRGVVTSDMQFHPEKLKGLQIGACLQDAEYRDKDGGVKMGVEVAFVCSVGRVSEVAPPAPKRINSKDTTERRIYAGPAEPMVNDDDIPF